MQKLKIFFTLQAVSYTHLDVYKRQVQGRREKNASSKWTEDRKMRHGEKLKEVWRKIKEQGITN